MAEDDAINPKTGRPMWDQRAARRAGVKRGSGYGKKSPNGSLPGGVRRSTEADLARSVAKKMADPVGTVRDIATAPFGGGGAVKRAGKAVMAAQVQKPRRMSSYGRAK